MSVKQTKTLSTLLEKIEWILTKPVIGYGERQRLEAMAKRIRLSLEPENPEALVDAATMLVNVIAECEPLRQARA